MYRVLIVDDEPEIRTGLRLKVDWASLELHIAAEASNGQEAIELIENELIDIVITDMSMPIMDGASLMDISSEQYPSLKLIVLTGYEDFEYARAAVKNQARDYLLKPVTGEELAASLLKVKQELDKEREQQKRATDMEWRLSRYYREMEDAARFDQQKMRASLDEGQTDIEAACRYIDDNYMFDLHLSMIAERFNYNPSYFSELFKGKAGKSFIQYLTDVRMSHARGLLENTALGLWDIAELTGFSNPSYFSSKFKKLYGLSPSDYRQRLSEKNDNPMPKK